MSCVDRLKELYPNLTEAEARNLDRIFNNLQGEFNTNAAAYNRAMRRTTTEFEVKVRNSLREKLNETTRTVRNIRHIMQENFLGNGYEGVASFLEHSNTNTANRNVNVENISETHRNQMSAKVLHEFRSRGLLDTVSNIDEMPKIAEAYDRLSPNFKDSIDPYEQAAWVIGQLNTSIIRRLQLAGSTIKAHKGYMMSQTHNDEMILNNPEEWSNDIVDALDWEKTWGTGEITSRKQAVERLMKFSKDIEGVGFSGPSLGKSGKRQFIFKDSTSWVNYNTKYGYHNFLDGINRSITRASKQIGLNEVLGPDPKKMLDKLVEVTEEVSPRSEALLPANKAKIYQALDVFTGVGTRLGNSMGDMTYRWARRGNMILALAKLGRSSFSAMEDFATSTLVHKMFTGDSLPVSSMKVLTNALGAISPQNRRNAAEMFSVALEGHNREMMEAVGVNRDKDGKIDRILTKGLDLMMVANLTTPITNTFRAGAVMGISKEFTKVMEMPRGKRNLEQQQALDSVGITDAEAETLIRIKNETGSQVVGTDTIEKSNLSPQMKQKLTNKVGSFYVQVSAMASPHMRNKQSRQMFRHLPKSHYMRSVMEAIFLFKGTIGAIQDLVTETMRSSTKEGTLNNPTAYATLARTMLVLGTGKYVADIMKEYVSTGEIKEVEDDDYVGLFRDALINSGAAGIWGQTMLDAVVPRYNYGTRLPAPFINTSKKLIQAGMSGDEEKFLKAVYGVTPFMNVWQWDNQMRREAFPVPMLDQFEEQ